MPCAATIVSNFLASVESRTCATAIFWITALALGPTFRYTTPDATPYMQSVPKLTTVSTSVDLPISTRPWVLIVMSPCKYGLQLVTRPSNHGSELSGVVGFALYVRLRCGTRA